jgi:hypothetical protein
MEDDATVRFCRSCGTPRADATALFCPRCGSRHEAISSKPEARTTPSRPLVRPATILLTLVVIIGSLWVLNNTRFGVSAKCHLLGDGGACLEEAFLQALAALPRSPVIGTSGSGGDPCALQLANHDASILVGTGGMGCEVVREQLASLGTWMDVSAASAASVGPQLCEGDWNGIHIQVLDTGAQFYGTEACQDLGLSQ